MLKTKSCSLLTVESRSWPSAAILNHVCPQCILAKKRLEQEAQETRLGILVALVARGRRRYATTGGRQYRSKRQKIDKVNEARKSLESGSSGCWNGGIWSSSQSVMITRNSLFSIPARDFASERRQALAPPREVYVSAAEPRVKMTSTFQLQLPKASLLTIIRSIDRGFVWASRNQS